MTEDKRAVEIREREINVWKLHFGIGFLRSRDCLFRDCSNAIIKYYYEWSTEDCGDRTGDKPAGLITGLACSNFSILKVLYFYIQCRILKKNIYKILSLKFHRICVCVNRIRTGLLHKGQIFA